MINLKSVTKIWNIKWNYRCNIYINKDFTYKTDKIIMQTHTNKTKL